MRLFVDNLTNVDFSYLDPQRGLLGETWLVSTELDGALDDQGMVCDFSIVKKALRSWLDTHVDHCLLVPSRSPNLSLQQTATAIKLSWNFADKTLHYSSPRDAVALVDSDVITPQSVADWSKLRLRQLLPASLDNLLLQFRPEDINGAKYHYSHGLKKHDGNCQRIAHGHRSRIQILRNGNREEALEQQWADSLRDIYIGTREDITQQNDHSYQFGYVSRQGEFALRLPLDCCYLIDSDSTVEWIATHMAERLKQQFPQDQFTVRAFEGAGKGAVVSR